MPPDPPRKQVPLALAIGRPQCSRTNLPLFHLDFQFFNLHLPVLLKSGLAALVLVVGRLIEIIEIINWKCQMTD